jgi:hypothetical protein
MTSERWFRRLLSVCPVMIAVLWVAGIAHFREYSLAAVEWVVIVAGAFALHVITARMRPPRPLPPLPAGTNPVTLAALAASIIALLAAIVGGVVEWLVQAWQPSATSWTLRTTWHASCSFGASYCGFLQRLSVAARKPVKKA